MVEIHKVDTTDPRDVKRFVQFPFRLYRDCPQWVPPLVSSARKQLNRERHPFYRHSDADCDSHTYEYTFAQQYPCRHHNANPNLHAQTHPYTSADGDPSPNSCSRA